MFISEVYQSNQGEGLLTGTPSVFVRVSGCNLRCEFCDTPFASWNPEGFEIPLNDLVEKVLTFDCSHVVITGGEPMIFKRMPELCRQLSQQGKHITIETAGTVYQDVQCDLMSISPKLSNSTPSLEKAGDWAKRHEKLRDRPDIVQQLINNYEHQLKFVIATQNDFRESLEFIAKLSDIQKEKVLMMPCGTQVTELDVIGEWLHPLCLEYEYQFCDRMHIRWYGNKRGT